MQKTNTEEQIALIESQASPEEIDSSKLLVSEKIKDGKAVRKARSWLQTVLLFLLIFEIVFIAYLVISQGIGHLCFFEKTKIPFALEKWTFGIFINGALVQTCILIKPIAANLFPNSKKNMD